MKKLTFIIGLILFLSIGIRVQAAQLGESLKFNIDSSYDVSGRGAIEASLVKVTPKLYFYIDKNWWDSQTPLKQNEIINILSSLSQKFENKIYPNLTSAFGSEWKPGIDGDERITILIHQMREGIGGYFREADEYLKIQFSESNEREMVYLAVASTEAPRPEAFLAHEFIHLITFNQKNRIKDASEEIWLNEARAEYASTFLSYDDPHEGSNLQRRVKTFLENPSDSVTEWLNKKADYGAVNLFAQYLVDHYGVGILADSLKSEKVGIPSINQALQKNGFKEDFSSIFTHWTIAVLVNNCDLGPKYCYKNPNLKNFRIVPSLHFLPTFGQGMLSFTHLTKNWSGNWFKIVGGRGVLKFEFDGDDNISFKVPYLVCDQQEKCQVSFLELDKKQKGNFSFSGFNVNYSSLTIIPFIQTKISNFNGSEPTYSFSWTAITMEKTPEEKEAELIKELLAQIEFLKKEIVKVQAQINAILGKKELSSFSCQKFESDLYYGIMQSSEVRCLQEFLKAQGPEIYPEGLITGNFLSLTKVAVIRFQEKYTSEILTPIGLDRGTGFVGTKTRAKINEILGR
jgi:hypothetical protein